MSSRDLPTSRQAIATRREAVATDAELRQFLGPPPLYEGESEADYTCLVDRLRAAVAPADVIEEIWVRDLADLTWETMRLRRHKAKLMEAARPEGLALMLQNLGCWPATTAQETAAACVTGDVRAKNKVDALLEKAHIDTGMIEAQTLVARLDAFAVIDRLLAQSEARRNAVLREIDRRREAVARRAREALTDVTDAEFEPVETSKDEAA